MAGDATAQTRLAEGQRLQGAGDVAGATAAYRAALAQAPGWLLAWALLVGLGTYPPGDTTVEEARAVLDGLDPSSADVRTLHFALGKARAGQGETALAMAHYGSGNAIARAGIRYNVADDEDLMARIAAHVGSDLIARAGDSPAGRQRPAPVFIVGMPRAGTTLVEQILARHPGVAAGGELGALPSIVSGMAMTGQGTSLAYPEIAAHLGAAELAQVAELYRKRLREAGDAAVVTDKNPLNFRYLGLLAALPVEAKLIHVHRDPADTCWSCYRQDFNDRLGFAFDLAELGRYYRAYDGLMQHWRDILPAGSLLEIAYADLVADPIREVARLLAHCGLIWDARCLAPEGLQRTAGTASEMQVRRPLHRDAVGRWQPYHEHLGPLFAALGPALAPAGTLD